MKITIPVTPMRKPRMVKSDAWRKRPTVLQYWEYKAKVIKHAKGFVFPDEAAAVRFDIPMPPSWSKKKRKELIGQPHKQTPDLDNLLKGLWDALCVEDCTIWHIAGAEKRWAETGSITIEIRREAA